MRGYCSETLGADVRFFFLNWPQFAAAKSPWFVEFAVFCTSVGFEL